MLQDFKSVEEFCQLAISPNFSFMHKDKWYLVSSELVAAKKYFIIREQRKDFFCQWDFDAIAFSTITELVNEFLIEGQTIAEIIYIVNGISLSLLPFLLPPREQDLCFSDLPTTEINNDHYNSCLRKALKSIRRSA
jgi:hypothetical protein